ncbi:MAG: outer membrane beta-barrel protein, partial [Candidatus Omnitrophica bacterium]|nr:outer membrane beta-barrel protein [Candidatus Omnitrophota bacterium]
MHIARKRIVRVCFIIFWVLSSSALSFAEQIPIISRENAMFAALNQVQQREAALKESLKAAEGKLLENAVIRDKKTVSFLQDLAKRVHPSLSIATQYNDNVDSAQHDHQGILSSSVNPGLNMNFYGRGKSLSLSASLANLRYNTRRVNNSTTGSMGLTASLGLDRYTLSIAENISTNRARAKTFGVETQGFAYYWQNQFAALLGRQFNRYGFDVGYNRTTYRYDHSPSRANNRFDEVYSLNQYLRLAPKTKLVFNYDHGRTQYQHKSSLPPTSNYNTYSVDITSALSYKLTGLLNVNYTSTDAKNADDSSELGFGIDMGYRVSDRFNFALNYAYSRSNPATDSAHAVTNSFGVSGDHRFAFNPKLSSSFDFGVTFLDSPKTDIYKHKSATFTWGGGLSYAFRKWLDFSFDWSTTKVHSNSSTK